MKILIATDGSQASRSVVEAACRTIKKPEDTAIKIVSAVEPITPMAAEPFGVSAGYYAEVETGLQKNAQAAVAQTEKDLKAARPNLAEVSSEVLRGAAAGRAIVETAREWSADLIVTGSHGYGFWSRALLGSVSNAVVHHAPCSVLVVRGK